MQDGTVVCHYKWDHYYKTYKFYLNSPRHEYIGTIHVYYNKFKFWND